MGTDLRIDLLGAIHIMMGAWDEVMETVASCFGKAGFMMNKLSEMCEDGVDDECMY